MDKTTLIVVCGAFAIIILGIQAQIVKIKQRIEKLEGNKK